jgi:hypothetical protein
LAVPADLALGGDWEEASAFAVFAMLLGAVPFSLNVYPHRASSVAIALAVSVTLLTAVQSHADDDSELVSTVVAAAVAMGILVVFTANRTLRRIAIPLSMVLFAACVGLVLSSRVGAAVCALQLGRSVLAAGLLSQLAELSIPTLVSTCVLAGLVFLAAIARIQERGLLDDLSLTAIFSLALVALLGTSTAIERAGVGWVVTTTTVWLAVSTTVYWWLGQSRSPNRSAALDLLVLRVFRRRRSASILLDDIATKWRYLGPVRQIAGADLAGFNVDLYGFIKFVTYRLSDLFVVDEHGRESATGSSKVDVSREGRFAVREVFRFESSWKQTVTQLIDRSAAILLDVRGFDGTREGITFEIEQLARRAAIARTVAIGDDTTKWELIDALVVRAGGPSAPAMLRFDLAGRRQVDRCIEHLLSVAQVPAS